MFATSPFSDGVFAETGNDGRKSGFSANGVVGIEAATDKSGLNDGVLGESPYGYGVLGIGVTANDSFGSVGVFGATLAASKTSKVPGGVVGIGVFGADDSSDGGIRNVGVVGMSNGVVAVGGAPPQAAGLPKRPALRTFCVNGGDSITGVKFSKANLFDFDCHGNLALGGALTTHGTMQITTAVKGGADVIAYAARTTRATIEDVGSATLHNGSASIAFDASFASAIGARTPYSVFVTPNGDSRGLYVLKSAAGFVIRERAEDGEPFASTIASWQSRSTRPQRDLPPHVR